MAPSSLIRRPWFYAWLGLVVIAIVLLVTTCPGCAAASSKRITPQQTQQSTQVAQQIDHFNAAIADLSTQVHTASTQIQNDLWPIVVIVGLVVLVGGLILALVAILAMRLIRSWIKAYSYLRQKPVWLKQQNDRGGESDLPTQRPTEPV